MDDPKLACVEGGLDFTPPAAPTAGAPGNAKPCAMSDSGNSSKPCDDGRGGK